MPSWEGAMRAAGMPAATRAATAAGGRKGGGGPHVGLLRLEGEEEVLEPGAHVSGRLGGALGGGHQVQVVHEGDLHDVGEVGLELVEHHPEDEVEEHPAEGVPLARPPGRLEAMRRAVREPVEEARGGGVEGPHHAEEGGQPLQAPAEHGLAEPLVEGVADVQLQDHKVEGAVGPRAGGPQPLTMAT